MPDNQNKRQPFEIVPIKRVDVYESVLAQLNALITESGMEPGDRLPTAWRGRKQGSNVVSSGSR